MFQQNQVLQTLSAPCNGERVDMVLADDRWLFRTQIARAVCEEFGFFDARGEPQVSNCAQALSKLEARRKIVLPKPENYNAAKAEPRRREELVPDPIALPDTVHGVRGLTIELVETDELRVVWNTLLDFEHPRRTTTFVEAQVRYLIGSAHGYLGAVGFSAAALRLAPAPCGMFESFSDTGAVSGFGQPCTG